MEATRARHSAAHSGADSDDCDTSESRGLCPVLAAIGVIGTEWRLAIVHRLLDGPQRFSEILKSNTHLNAKTLSATLKFLENQGVVQRTVVSTRAAASTRRPPAIQGELPRVVIAESTSGPAR